MACDRAVSLAFCVVLLLGMTVNRSLAQTAMRFSMQTTYPEILESFHCDESSPDRWFELLSLPPQGDPLPIQDPACMKQFSSRLRLQQAEGWTAWRIGQPPKIFCHADPVLVEAPLPSGRKPMFCGTICSHGQPVRVCTR